MTQSPTQITDTPSAAEPGQRIALVVGVNGSEQADFLAPLKHAEQDAADLAQVLRRSACGFAVHTRFGEQAVAEALQDAFFDLRVQFTDDDLLLLYFSGHAEPLTTRDRSTDIFFVTSDYHPDKARRTPERFFSLNWLRRELDRADDAGNILVILDCCYAGNAVSAGPDPLQSDIRSLIKRYDENQSITSEQHKTRLRVILTAAGYNQKAYEHRSLTRLLLPALRGEVRDARDAAGDVVLQNLHSHIQQALPTSYLVNDITRRCVLARYTNLSEVAIQQRNREARQQEQAERRQQRLEAMLPDHTGFLRDRLESFVGRETELADIRQRIAEKLPTGGYVTITGQAGQGKSSIIAKLVEEYGIDDVAYHFIPFNPGPDHQISLLRNLMARLILKHDLSDTYVASESRPALRDFFPRVLQEIKAKGEHEVIFLDGLDQLEPEQSGERDLSFLPTDVPAGVVFVLGTRPNDTLKPLELLKPHHEYQLPNLSRADFDLILAHRKVMLDRSLADRFYTAMQKNALYLDLVAKELAEAPDRDPEALIQCIADNPENIFSLTMERLRRNRQQWREIIKPVLGLLLAAQEPLSLRALRALLGVDDHDMREGLRCLGGLLACDSQGHYSLFHLKLYDFLRQDESRPNSTYIFATDEEEGQHAKLGAWCAQGQGGLTDIWQDAQGVEQERRRYARQHFITHLYHAKDDEQLFAVLDEGSYGRAKLHWDTSTRSYADDLNLGRQAAARDELPFEDGLRLLPNLWRYSLLRCTLASRADTVSDKFLEGLIISGHIAEALSIAELFTKPERQARVFILASELTSSLSNQGNQYGELLKRATIIARKIRNREEQENVLRGILRVQLILKQWNDAESTANLVCDVRQRIHSLSLVVESLIDNREISEAQSLLGRIQNLAIHTRNHWESADMFRQIITGIKQGVPDKESIHRTVSREASGPGSVSDNKSVVSPETRFPLDIGLVYQEDYALRSRAVLSIVDALLEADWHANVSGLLGRAFDDAKKVKNGHERAKALSLVLTICLIAHNKDIPREIDAIAFGLMISASPVAQEEFLVAYPQVEEVSLNELNKLLVASQWHEAIKWCIAQDGRGARTIIKFALQSGELESVLKTLQSYDTGSEKILDQVCYSLATSKEWDEIIEIANTITSDALRRHFLIASLQRLVSQEEPGSKKLLVEPMVQALIGIGDDNHYLAEQLMLNGYWSLAKGIICRVRIDGGHHIEGITFLVNKLLISRQYRRALEIVCSIEM